MRLRSLGLVAVAAASFVQSCQPACTPAPVPAPAPEVAPPPPPPPPDISAVTIAGQGNGHGHGLSAWGDYALAVNWGWSWQEILDYYYGGTARGTAANSSIGVRLLGLDGAQATGVISTRGAAMWAGVGYGALQTRYAGGNQFDVFGYGAPACPFDPVAWVYLGRVAGPVTFTTPYDQSAAAPGDVLGVCQPNGSVIHYRGSITARIDGNGATRTVDDVLIEDYLRGVLSREVSTSWGDAGGGAGMHSLWAMAVAARSFALSQNRYGYARTCDSSACQVYGGAAYRASPTAPTSHPGVRVCEVGNLTFECANTNRAAADTAGVVRVWPATGAIVSTQYSASHGPRSAGGPFPVVDDSISNIPQNTLYSWYRNITAEDLEARYGLGNLLAASSEPDPASPDAGIWANRVVLQGTARTVVVSNLDFRNAYGFPSQGFVVTGTLR